MSCLHGKNSKLFFAFGTFYRFCVYLALAPSLTACAANNAVNIPQWNNGAVMQSAAAEINQSNTVQVVVLGVDMTPISSGTGVILAGTSVHGFPAIITVEHVGDLRSEKSAKVIQIVNNQGEVLGSATPIYQGYPNVPAADDVIALAIDPASVIDRTAWSGITGAQLSDALGQRDLFTMVSLPSGMIGGDSGSGWFDQTGHLIGLSSRVIYSTKSSKLWAIGRGNTTADQAADVDMGDAEISKISVPIADLVLVDKLDSPYLRGLFPSLFFGKTFTNEVSYSQNISMGFGGGIFTMYLSPKVQTEDSCLTLIDSETGTPSPDVSNVGQIMTSPVCKTDNALLEGAAL